jgi:hypothetical protein
MSLQIETLFEKTAWADPSQFRNVQPYDDIWRKVRILARRILSPVVSRTYIPYQDVENKAMLLGFLQRPDHFIEHIRRYSSSLTTQMTYGFRITSEEDPRRTKMFEVFISNPLKQRCV